MEADFRGYATKAGLKCTDGRTIMPDAFKHQDQLRVPLVWQHGHKDPENVLGHAILENRDDGVYAYGFFNKSVKANAAYESLVHGDINMMSIWANDLVQKSGRVLHGAIREVSLVLSGANPGAIIEHVTLRHSDGEMEDLDDEAIIYTGLELEIRHSADDDDDYDDDDDVDDNDEDDEMQHADDGEKTVKDVYDSMTEEQQQVLHFMIGEAIESQAKEVKQSNLNDDNQEGNEMKHNVFESRDKGPSTLTLSHDDISGIVADATKNGSLKDAVENYALSHGIEDIDILFPDAVAVDNTPEFLARRTEWVSAVLGGVKKSPFSRIKTRSADITAAEARAKGYITGTLKKEEFFKVSKRVTTPTTIYKKQKLDRDDMIDITDFDVVVWLKGEMRVMLDEELARAILVGDGREALDEDKIDEERIRPIANDHELYTTTVYVNIDDASSSMNEAFDAITMNRSKMRGTGLPTMYTTETYIARTLTQRDTLGRKIYTSLDQLATELRVQSIVPVEVLEEYSDIVAILVNPVDYTVGATAGGQVSMFDDFDIDYNQYKYLIETRCCGALTKLKAAMVVRKVVSTAVLVTPAEPTFDGDAFTIVNTTGVVYRRTDTDAVVNAAGSPYAVADGVTVTITAEPASASYYFATSDDDEWSFTGTA
jgi:hypothetical protein